MKKTTTKISARYDFTLRAIRAQGYRVSAFNGHIFATHPESKQIVFSGNLEAAEEWVLGSGPQTTPAPPELPVTQDPGFWAGIVFGLLALGLSQVAIFCSPSFGVVCGPLSIVFLLLAIFRVERKTI